jgi:DNA (cytosine-5)-methyltransferase 1
VNILSLFSGVGGFDMGLEAAGWNTTFQCEWDKHCQRVLKRKWPHVPKWLDVSTLTGARVLEASPPPDVVAWGSPCQDLSVAGKRAGLSGEKSSLFHEGIRIIQEIRELTNNEYPRISIWENVPGALTSNGGADFGVVLDEMAKTGAVELEWSVLDAQYFGVPQRRRRIFIVAFFRTSDAERSRPKVLPVAESLPRNIETRIKARESIATTAAEGPFGDRDEGNRGIVSENVKISQLQMPFAKSRRAKDRDDFETWVTGVVSPTLNTFENGTDTRATALIVSRDPLVFENSYRDGVRVAKDGVTQTLTSKMGTGGNNAPMVVQGDDVAIPIQDGREMEKNQNGFGVGENGDPSYTLDQTGSQSVAYSIREDAHAGNFSATEIRVANAISALRPSVQSHHAQTFITQPDDCVFSFDTQFGSNATVLENTSPTIKATQASPSIYQYDGYNQKLEGDGSHRSLRVGRDSSDFIADNTTPSMLVRRLTPLECERLMGWPENHTQFADDGTRIADSQRYKMCGNGVAAPVATWIAKKINEVISWDNTTLASPPLG